jgi:hypothetical protein
MDDRIRQLLGKITALEDELRTELHEREERLFYTIEGSRIEFEEAIREAHRKARVGILRWFTTVRPQNFLTAPIIYGLGVPLLFLDLCVTVFQALCFPIYRIARVRRADYIAVDRQQLEYLNAIERFHCTYCAYANGLLAYAAEVAGRTEQYFCPIKHAQKIVAAHSRYGRFLPYGQAEAYHDRLEEFRKALEEEMPR